MDGATFVIVCRTASGLQEALEASDTNDIIVVGSGEHQIRGSGSLEEGGTIKGIGSFKDTIICPLESVNGPTLLDLSDGEVNTKCINEIEWDRKICN